MTCPHPNILSSPLPSLRQTIKTHNLDAQKSLGQHFLLDMNITRKIARLATIKAEDKVLEIGPGPGGLTRALLEMGADLTIIERDDRCMAILEELQHAWPKKLHIRNGDALRFDYQNYFPKETGYKIVSNLPYNISTELLVQWLLLPPENAKNSYWQQMTLMFQKEVADRILAKPGSKAYGRLSILSQIASSPSRAYDLSPQAFTPPPKVDSTVVTFMPKQSPFPHINVLEHITRNAFSQRRKMIRTTLQPVFGEDLQDTLSQADLKPTMRAEELTIENYMALAHIKVNTNK